jgi:hypothetical protein
MPENADLTAASAWFATSLDWLFVTLRVPGGPKITNVAAAEHVANYTGGDCSDTYIGRLRKPKPGERLNPSLAFLLGIADFFKISAAYFVDPVYGAKVQASIKIVVAIRDAGPRRDAVISDVTAVLHQTAGPVTPAALALAVGLSPQDMASLDHTLSSADTTGDAMSESDPAGSPALRHAAQALRKVATEMTTDQLEALAGLLQACTPQVRADQITALAELVRSFVVTPRH